MNTAHSERYEAFRLINRYKKKVLEVKEFFGSYATFLTIEEQVRLRDIWNEELIRVESKIEEFGNLPNNVNIEEWLRGSFDFSGGDDIQVKFEQEGAYTPLGRTYGYIAVNNLTLK